MRPLQVGDVVVYTVDFLLCTGGALSPMAHDRGPIESIQRVGEKDYASVRFIAWEEPRRVLLDNLARPGTLAAVEPITQKPLSTRPKPNRKKPP